MTGSAGPDGQARGPGPGHGTATVSVDQRIRAEARALARTQTGAGLAARVARLGWAFYERYEHHRRLDDLDCATMYLRDALRRTPADSAAWLDRSHDLATALTARLERTGRTEDFAEAARLHGHIRARARPGTALAVLVEASLGRCWLDRFRHGGDPADLDKAICLLKQAAASLTDAAEERSPLDCCFALDTLGDLKPGSERHHPRRARAEAVRSNLRALLEQAVQQRHRLRRDAEPTAWVPVPGPPRPDGLAEAAPPPPALRGAGQARSALAVLNQSGAWHRHYLLTREAADLEEALAAARRALSLPYPAPDRWRPAAQAGACLLDLHRHDATGHPDACDEAIELLETGLGGMPPGHAERAAERAAVAARLGVAFLERYAARAERGDLEQAIEHLESARRGGAADAPTGLPAPGALGRALLLRAELTGQPADAEQALAALRAACSPAASPLAAPLAAPLAPLTTPPAERTVEPLLEPPALSAFDAARAWLAWALQRRAWDEVAEASGQALRALVRAAPLRSLLGARAAGVEEAERIAATTALATVRDRRAPTPAATVEAAVALETGRELVLDALLERDREHLEQLRAGGHARLHDRSRSAAEALLELETSHHGAGPLGDARLPAADWRRARADLEEVTAAVQALPGHHRFRRVPAPEEVLTAAGPQPVVYLAAGSAGGVAVVVRGDRDGSVTVDLPDLTEAAVAEQVAAYVQARQQPDVAWRVGLEQVLEWLWAAGMGQLVEVLRPAVGAVLVPCGQLGLLPLHAARVRDPDTPTGWRYALDELRLTYAPSANALNRARRHGDGVGASSLLAIVAPEVGGTPRLPGQELEVAGTGGRFARRKVLQGEEATRQAVADALHQFATLHFACHALADPRRPLEGRLLLTGDDDLTLREAKRPAVVGLRLVVLSSCETIGTGATGTGATGAGQEPPAATLTLPMALAGLGVPGVVGSLWGVPDSGAALLVRRFYQLWRDADHEPADALRAAQHWVRDTTDEQRRTAFPDVPAGAWPAPAPQDPAASRADQCHPAVWAAFAYFGA